MTLSNIKCKGCGTYLQDTHSDKPGYVTKINLEKEVRFKYCQRCFKIKNYNYKPVNINQDVVNILDNIELENALLVMVVDICDLENSLIREYQNHSNLIIVVNKCDLFVNNQNIQVIEKNVIDNILTQGYQPLEIIFCSIKSNSSVKKLFTVITDNQFNKLKIIFVGKSNVGKTSLINKMMQVNKQKHYAIVSNQLNTTNNYQKNIINKKIIIDTPGTLNTSSLLNYVDAKYNDMLLANKIKRARIFQIKHNKCLIIENLFYINIFLENSDQPGSVTFYINDGIDILSTNLKSDVCFNQINKIGYLHSSTNNLQTFILDKQNANLVISSLGIIKFSKIDRIEITYQNNVGIYLLSKQII